MGEIAAENERAVKQATQGSVDLLRIRIRAWQGSRNNSKVRISPERANGVALLVNADNMSPVLKAENNRVSAFRTAGILT